MMELFATVPIDSICLLVPICSIYHRDVFFVSHSYKKDKTKKMELKSDKART